MLDDHVRDRIIYRNIVFDDFHKLWTQETGIHISMPKVQEISQWKILHEYWVAAGRLDEETVLEMWRSMEIVYNPSVTLKEAIIVCRQGQVSIHSAPRSKAAGPSWDEARSASQVEGERHAVQSKAPLTSAPQYGPMMPGSRGDG